MSGDMQKYSPRPVEPSVFTKQGRLERHAQEAYVEGERQAMLRRAELARTVAHQRAAVQGAGVVGYTGQQVTEQIGTERDAAIVRHGESLTSMDIDNITQIAQREIANIVVQGIREVGAK